MFTAHLICGATGAGKSTYAHALAEREGAVRFSVDEWMATLFWRDAPQPLTYEWALERTRRCEAQILAVVAAMGARGVDAVLDLGFFSRDQRMRVAAAVAEGGGAARLHYLPVPEAVRWARVARRNDEQGDTYSFTVTRGIFDFAEGLFEPPGEDELAGAVVLPEPAA